MSSDDGRVRIIIDTNAKEAIKEFNDVSKSFTKNAETINKASTVYGGFEKVVQENTQLLRELALGGNQNTEGFKKLAVQTKEYQNALQDANAEVDKALGGFNNLSIGGIKVGSILKGIGWAAAIKAIVDIGKASIQTAGEFEQLETSFKIMAGSAEQGERLTQSLIDLAAKTPMTTSGLARATQTLLSFGESSENVIDDLKLLGDISGGEEQRFQSLALAFAQIGSTGRLTGQDLLQMVNQGFNPLQAISEKTGKSMATLKKEMGDGKISFDMVKQAMIDTTSEGGRFYGLMEEQSETLNGKLSTLSDTWQMVGKSIGDAFLPMAKAAVGALNSIGQATDNVLKFLLDEKTTLKDVKKSWDEYWASKRKIDKTLAFSFDPYLKEKSAQQSAKVAKSNGGFGGNNDNQEKNKPKSKKSKEVKDAFEQLQAQAQASQKQLKAALAVSGGQITPLVEAATQKLKQNKLAVESVQKAYESLTATAKTPFEQLNYNIEQSRQKIIALASQPVVDLDAIREAQNEYKNYLEQQEQINLYLQPAKGAYQELSDKVAELTVKLRDLAAENKIGTQEWANNLEALKSAQNQLTEVNKSLEEQGIKADEASHKIASSLSSGIINTIRNGGNAFESFSEIAINALQKVLDKVLEFGVVEPILKTLTGGAGGAIGGGGGFFGKILGSIFGLSDGGVLYKGKISPFARGGVVNKPTIFPMANGGTGLMGEAGAEAVMPLRRMSNGRLGVEASSESAKTVQVNIYNQSNSQVETRKRDDGSMDIIIKRVNEALMSERTSSGFRSAYQREASKGVQAA